MANNVEDRKLYTLDYEKLEDRAELYTITIQVPYKQQLLDNLTAEPKGWRCPPIPITTGSLAGSNSFKAGIAKPGTIYLFYPAPADIQFGSGTRELTINFSLFANGVMRFSGATSLRSEYFALPNGPTGICVLKDMDERDWPEQINVWKIEIRIEEAKEPRSGWAFLNVGKYFLSTELADIEITCGNEVFPAHRFVLKGKSPAFERMLINQSNGGQVAKVDFRDTDPAVLREMLRFLYMGRVEGIETLCGKLYELANFWKIEGLKTLCENDLIMRTTKDNVLKHGQFAKLHNMPRLTQHAKLVFEGEKRDVIKSSTDLLSFLCIAPEFMYELMMD